jgi:hypothetical protein
LPTALSAIMTIVLRESYGKLVLDAATLKKIGLK